MTVGLLTISFSIILAAYNRGDHIKPTIESALRQTVQDFELIVVGDGCDDGTQDAVLSFRSPKISWRNREANTGSQSAPNNKGIRQARQPWIAYLGHDDVWAPDHLERLRETIEAEPAPDIAVSGCVYHGPEGSGVYWLTGIFGSDDAPFRDFFPPSSVAHRRVVPEWIGTWRDPRSQDRRLRWPQHLADPGDAQRVHPEREKSGAADHSPGSVSRLDEHRDDRSRHHQHAGPDVRLKAPDALDLPWDSKAARRIIPYAW